MQETLQLLRGPHHAPCLSVNKQDSLQERHQCAKPQFPSESQAAWKKKSKDNKNTEFLK
jgi:hypothetical protein